MYSWALNCNNKHPSAAQFFLRKVFEKSSERLQIAFDYVGF